jgi:hypothetical protein
VLEPNLLADLGVLVQRERQRRGLGEHGQLGGRHLDLAGRQVRVLVARRAPEHLADDPHAELGAQPVRPLGHLALAEHHLRRARRVPQVDEDHSAVITTPGHPPGEGDGLSGVLGSQRAGGVGAHHGTRLSGDTRWTATRFLRPPAGARSRWPDRPCLRAAGRRPAVFRSAQSRLSCSTPGPGPPPAVPSERSSAGSGSRSAGVGSSNPCRRSNGATRRPRDRRYSGST